jgi:hypothetical protein
MALLMHHVTKTPEPPSTHVATIPAELDDIVLHCLRKSPEDRPAGVLELRERLSAVPLDDAWSEGKAAAWWAEHLPETGPEEAGACEGPCGEAADPTTIVQTDDAKDIDD